MKYRKLGASDLSVSEISLGYMLAMPAIEIAKAEKSFFPSIDVDVLARCIA
jgi:aryl-alcohol dehydrogenase-like predicted oxidoreductase